MGEVEWNIKFKPDIGNDMSMYSFGNRKILKGEMVFEYQNVVLKKINHKFETEKCNLVASI
jgi:hypothetical protein